MRSTVAHRGRPSFSDVGAPARKQTQLQCSMPFAGSDGRFIFFFELFLHALVTDAKGDICVWQACRVEDPFFLGF